MNGTQSQQKAKEAGGLCLDHENRITRNAQDISKLQDSNRELDNKREEAVRRVHKRLDAALIMIVSAMGIVILQGAVLLFQFIVHGG